LGNKSESPFWAFEALGIFLKGGSRPGLTGGFSMVYEIALKLHPGRLPGMPSKMAAILGHMLNQPWADPEIIDLCITSDGFLLGQRKGDMGFNDMLGTEDDLKTYLEHLVNLKEVGLTKEEVALVWQLFQNIKR
jgi:hypothetical protein